MNLQKQLTPTLKKGFDRDGVVVLRNVFSKEWLDKTEIAVEENKKNVSEYGESLKGANGGGVYFNDYMNWQKIPQLRDYVYNSPAAKIAKFLTGAKDLIFYHDHILCKEPGTSKETPWHHDQAYYPVEGDKCCSIWMPLDIVGEKETIMFIKGSHKKGYFLPYKFATEKVYPVTDEETLRKSNFKPIPDDITEIGEIVQWEANPGDCVVFHMKTIHGAHPNLSTRHRRVLSTRWLGEDAVCAKRPWVTSPPVTGALKPGDKFQQDDLFPIIPC